MEQSRLLLAIGLSLLVFLLWNLFFIDEEAIQRQREERARKETIETKQEDVDQGQKIVEPVEEEPAAVEIGQTDKPLATIPMEEEAIEQPAKMLTVKTPLYTAQISEKGAMIKSFLLHKYFKSASEDSEPYQMAPAGLDTGTITLEFSGNQLNNLNSAIFRSDYPSSNISVFDAPKNIAFTHQTENGVIVQKEYVFDPQSYKMGLNVRIINKSEQNIQGQAIVGLKKLMPKDVVRFGFSGPSAHINGKLEQIAVKDIAKQNTYAGQVDWIAVEDRYFITALMPNQGGNGELRLFLNGQNLITSKYAAAPMEIQARMQASLEYDLFIGPKKVNILKQIGHQLDKAVDFGWFDFIAKPFLAFLNFLYQYIPNYGVVIIILTLLIKIVLWPLGNKGYKSMAEMKKLQPLMAEIKEKYKGDKKRIQEETMQLYKTYKVNPVGGCLPMVVQIPVFFAFYRMLYQAIELRHAPFIGWINDLSAPDRLGNFGFSIPFMEAPYGIPVLTIIMGGTMYLQQKMTPAVGDATQAKIMQFMPLAFTVIFINFSSGLVLYWLVNNVVSIAQQYYIQKKTI